MSTITAAAIEVEDSLENESDMGVAPQTDGVAEAVLPAPGPVSIFVQIDGEDEVTELLCVGWNGSGSPVVVGSDGGLRLLDDDELIRDITW